MAYSRKEKCLFARAFFQRQAGINTPPLAAESGEAAVGYGIHRDYRDCGYEAEAIDAIIEYCFSSLGAQKIKMSYHVGNLAELREIERLGMQLLLENEDCVTFDGRPFKRNTYILSKPCSN